MQNNSFVDFVEVAVQLIALAARVAPPIARWLHDVLEGRTDVLSTRVRDILPEESRSAAVERELGG